MAASPSSAYPLLVESLLNITVIDSLLKITTVDSLLNITDESVIDSLLNITDESCEAIRQFPPLPSVVLGLLLSLLIVLANVQLITVIFCTRELRRQVLVRVLKNFAIVQLFVYPRDSTCTSTAWPSLTWLWAFSSP